MDKNRFKKKKIINIILMLGKVRILSSSYNVSSSTLR